MVVEMESTSIVVVWNRLNSMEIIQMCFQWYNISKVWNRLNSMEM